MFMEYSVHRLSGILLDDSADPSALITHIYGHMHLDNGEDIGRIRAKKVMLGQALAERRAWVDICDDSPELMNAYEALCDDQGYQDFISPGQGFDLLYIEAVEVLKGFRGHSVGKALVLETIDMFQTGCAVVALEAHPVRHLYSLDKKWDAAMKWEKLAHTDAQYAVGAKKLRRHWRSLGFRPVPKDKHLMYRDCGSSHKVKQPPIRASLRALEDHQ